MTRYILNIEQDEYPESPREWDNLGTMYCEHRRYTLGDKKAEDIRDDGKLPFKDYIILPLYGYDHGGLSISTTGFSCPWDSGQLGYIYVSKEKVRKEYSWKVLTKARVNKIKEYLRGEVKTYDQYLTGNVYNFVLEKVSMIATGDGEEELTEEIDSCCGFYGSDPFKNGMSDYFDAEILANMQVKY